jgi:O-antigen ligase
MFVKRITENGLNGAVLFMGLIVFPPAGGFAQIDPVRSFVTGTIEPFGIYEGLYKIDGVFIKL